MNRKWEPATLASDPSAEPGVYSGERPGNTAGLPALAASTPKSNKRDSPIREKTRSSGLSHIRVVLRMRCHREPS